MKYLLYPLLLLTGILFSTGAFAQIKESDVVVFDKNTPVPAHCKLIGKVKILNDGNRADASYWQIMREARTRVAKQGGNVYKITKLTEPSSLDNRYQVWGQVYYTDSMHALKEEAAAKDDSIVRTLISDTAKYALLYIYRPRKWAGSAWKHTIHADDIELCNLKNGSTSIVKIEKEGITDIWCTGNSSNKVNIKFGRVYFVKSEIGIGVWVINPLINVQPIKHGYEAFMKVKAEE